MKSNKLIVLTAVLLIGVASGGYMANIFNQESSAEKKQINNKSTQSLNNQNPVEVFEKASKSVVVIKASLDSTNRYQKQGLGVIYNDRGYIVTNSHIVNDTNEIKVVINERERTAKLIDSDKNLDIAVIKIDSIDVKPAKLADFSKVKVGDEIRVIGKPLSGEQGYTLTSGIISILPINLPKGWPTLLTVDAIVNAGNSGGAVVNMDGEVVAITTAYQSTGIQTNGLGFAIPIDKVIKVVRKIIDQ